MDQWRPIWEIVFGTGALIVSLIIHGIGMFYIQRLNRDYYVAVTYPLGRSGGSSRR